MAIIKKGKIKGKIGNYVYRVLNGQEIVQTYPKKFKQTDHSKKASVKFGKASKIGSSVYKQLKSFALDFTKVNLYRETVSLLRKSLFIHPEAITSGDEDWTLIAATDSLLINKEILLSAFLDKYPSASFSADSVTVTVPVFGSQHKKRNYPRDANYVEFYVSVYHTHPDMTYELCKYQSGRLSIHEHYEEQKITLPMEWMDNIDKKGLVYICFGLSFFATEDSRSHVNVSKSNPSAMLGMWHKNS